MSHPSMTNAGAERPVSAALIRRTIIAALVGSVVEWYDFALYGAASALVFAYVFFDPTDMARSAVYSFLTFAAGFVVRPIGGIIFGHFGDRIGRRPMLVITLVLMGVSTTCIGLLPTRASIGWSAAVLLVALRAMQGLGAGAEYAGALLVASESSRHGQRGRAGAWPAAGTYMGTLLALGALTLVSLLPREAFLAWGWRVPFLASAAIVAFGYWVRTSVPETAEFEHAKERGAPVKAPVLVVLRTDWRRVLVAMGTTFTMTGYSYVLQVFALRYLTAQVHLTAAQALIISSSAYAAGVVLLPLWGRLADKVGARRLYIAGAIFGLLYIVPMFLLVNTASVAVGSLAFVLGLSVGVCSQFAAQASFLTTFFPVEVRFTGIALVREVTNALVAGPAPAVAAILVAANNGGWSYLAVAMGLCSLITIGSLVLAGRFRESPAGG